MFGFIVITVLFNHNNTNNDIGYNNNNSLTKKSSTHTHIELSAVFHSRWSLLRLLRKKLVSRP